MLTLYYFFFKEEFIISEHKTAVLEGGEFAFKNVRQVDVLKEKVNKFKNFSDINQASEKLEEVEIGLPESLAQTNIFRDLFCNHPFRQGKTSLQAPIYLDLASIQTAWGKIAFDKNGNPNFDLLKNGKFEKYIPALKNIAEVYMLYLSVKGNPNKFLRLALDYREKNMVSVKFNGIMKELGQQPINSPTWTLYIGLDRIAQFLNFCVLINSLMANKDGEIKKVEPLSFEKDVLKKLLEQIKAAKVDLDDLIKKCGNKTLNQYKKELREYREKYDQYVADCAKNNKDQNVLNVLTFVEWMDNGVRNANGIDYSRIKRNDDYKNKLDILLYLDSILQCEAAIDKFIDSKALEPSILNWFKNAWNSIKSAWNFLANKMELSQGWLFNIGQEKKDMQFKSNEIIPNLDLTQYKKTDPNLDYGDK